MENTVKVKKKDVLKPFSIVAGVLMILLALSIVFVNTATFLVQYYSIEDSAESSAEISTESSAENSNDKAEESKIKKEDIINLVLKNFSAIVSIVLLTSAAVILFVNKNVSGIYIPMGLLTFTAISPLLNSVSQTIVNLLFGNFRGTNAFWVGGISGWYIVSAVVVLISLAIVAVPTIFFFIASCTFMKKVKAIPMFIIFGVLVLGSLVTTALALLSLLGSVLNTIAYMEIITILLGQGRIGSVLVQLFSWYVSPLLAVANSVVMCLAALLAAIGMCSKPKVVVAADAETVENAEPAQNAEPVDNAEPVQNAEPAAEN